MKKPMKRIFAVLLSAAVCGGCVTPALAADSGVTKDETVYLILNDDGSVKEQYVSDWLHSDGGFQSYRDKTALTDVENLKSGTRPERESGALVWDTDETDLYYRGGDGLTPPLTVSIAYTLDGRAVSAGELAGQSGRLEIRLAVENNDWEEVTIDGRRRQVCTPFFTVCAAMLDAESFRNVDTERGTVQSDSKNELVCAMLLPGAAESLDGLIPEELEDIEDYLLDELVITADVTDCEIPVFLLAASPSMEGLSEGLDDGALTDSMDELEEATEELTQGTEDLDEAVATLEEKLTEFGEGYVEFDRGVNSALSGTEKLTQGAEELLDSAETLRDKTGELSAGAAQLEDGAAQLSGTLNTELAQSLAAAREEQASLQEEMTALSGALESVTIPDMTALQTDLAAGVGQVFDAAAYNAAYNAALTVGNQAAYDTGTAVKNGCEQVVAGAAGDVAAGIQESYNAAIAAALQQAGLDEASIAAVVSGVNGYVTADAVSAAISGNINGAIDSYAAVPESAVSEDAAASAAEQVTAAMAGAREEAVAQVGARVPDLDTESLTEMMDGFRDLSQRAQGMLGQVDTLTAALYNAENPADRNTVAGAASTLAAGAKEISDGASALSEGTGLFAQGAGTLFSGAAELLDGMTALASSSKTVEETIYEFQDGGAELRDGTTELKDGMAAFADEAIGALLDMADPDSGLAEALDVMEKRAAAYEGTGRSQGTDMSVKLVMRTEAVSAETEDGGREEETQPAAGDESFWDRVKGLFS